MKFTTKTRNLLLAALGIITVMITIVSYIPKQTTTPEPSPIPTSTDANFTPPDEPIPTPLSPIQELQLQTAGVKVETLYKNNPEPQFRSDTTIAETDTYSILFLAQDAEFVLNLYQQPFDQTQTAAEEALVNSLQITRENACKLNVTVIKRSGDTTQPPETTKKLSFC